MLTVRGRGYWMWLWGGAAAVALAGATGSVLSQRTHDGDARTFLIDFIDEDIHIRVEIVSPDDPAVAAGPPARDGTAH